MAVFSKTLMAKIPGAPKGVLRSLCLGAPIAVLAALLTLLIPNSYRSVATLLPAQSQNSGGLGSLAAMATAFGANVSAGGGVDAQAESILKSRWVRESLVGMNYEFSDTGWAFGRPRPKKTTLYNYLRAHNMDQAVDRLGAMMRVSKDTNTMVLTLAVSTNSPKLSQDLAVRATDLLDEFLSQKARTRGGEKAEFAAKRLAESTQQLNEAETNLKSFISKNLGYQTSSDPGIRIQGQRLESEFKLRQQLMVSLALSYEQALMDKKNDLPILNILDHGNYPYEKDKPHRSLLVLLALFLSSGLIWTWSNRELLRNALK